MANCENLTKDEIEKGTRRLILKLKNEKINEEILKKTINEHKETLDVISKLNQKLNYKIIVPFSKLAFYEGEIKYTNNIYQDIGCNTYCERTAEKAAAHIQKKLDFYEKKYKTVSDLINKLTKEIELSLELDQSFKRNDDDEYNSNVFLRPDGFLEIREEYNESDEGHEKYVVDTHERSKKNKNVTKMKMEKCEKNKLATTKNQNIIKEEGEKREHISKYVEYDESKDRDKIVSREITSMALGKSNNNVEKSSKELQIGEKKQENIIAQTVSKLPKNKPLNVNERGLLNITEHYSSDSSSSSSIV
ncbi:conserved protein, unknown function [Hepatocystis sp. ex Piliocolobus tephrosceles]|nr:conserved protein, unknown function [Hepatocystis sp. ex Piliocolobus tephrosceles]